MSAKRKKRTALEKWQIDEMLKCGISPLYFIENYCKIYDAQALQWIPFELWPAQVDALDLIHQKQFVIALKARQLGLTWLGLGYALWQMLFRPIAAVMLFSRRDDEAVYILGEERLKGMYKALPEFMQAKEVIVDSAHQFTLSNGSTARAFPTSAGDSYTSTMVIVDEADLVPDFNRLMRSVKPTTDAGGKLILISRADKSRPETEFKNIYNDAKVGKNGWSHIFLPWYVRPERDQAWYELMKADSISRTGTLDDLWEQYPATDLEALAAKTLDKRISPAWLQQCYVEQRPIDPPGAPAINGLRIYKTPVRGGKYVGGLDPAEGNPTSDDSAMTFLDRETGEEVAMLAGKFQPSVLAAHADSVGQYFNNADLMVERNNHGHAVLLWLKDNSKLKRLDGFDGREGWHSTTKGKAILYDTTADSFKDGETVIHSYDTLKQLESIEGSTLRAPEGQMDDKSDSYALALVGIRQKARVGARRVGVSGLYSNQ